MIGFCQHYYAVKCAAVQYLVLYLVYVLLGERCLYGKDLCIFLRPLAPNATRQARLKADAQRTLEAVACTR